MGAYNPSLFSARHQRSQARYAQACSAWATLEHHDIGSRARAVPVPRVHLSPASPKEISAPIGCLHLIGDSVGQRRLGHEVRCVCTLCGPIFERGPNPWVVMPGRSSRSSNRLILLSGRPCLDPGKTKSFCWSSCISLRMANTRSESGTRCSLPPFMRWTGTIHMRAPRSISSQCAPRASPLLTAVRITNSRARALTPLRARKASMNAGIFAQSANDDSNRGVSVADSGSCFPDLVLQAFDWHHALSPSPSPQTSAAYSRV